MDRGIITNRDTGWQKGDLEINSWTLFVQRNTYETSVSILQNWIEKCDRVKPSDAGFYPKQRIENPLKNAKGFLNLYNLKIKNPWLHNVVLLSHSK